MRAGLVSFAVAVAIVTSPAASANQPAVAATSWAGCYAGGTAGWIGDRSSSTFGPGGAFLTFLGPVAVNAFTKHYRYDESGATIGGLAGCNGQWGHFVGGVEGDLNWSNVKSSVFATYPLQTAPGGQTFNPHSDSLSNSLRWYGTLRGRAGFAVNRVLIFGTGGLVLGKLEASGQLINPAGVAAFSGTMETTRSGWTAGGGMEFMLSPNWTARAEYLYIDLGRYSFYSQTSPPSVFVLDNHFDAKFHVVRAGATYRFLTR
jgi:outer membrane immunogenic protein